MKYLLDSLSARCGIGEVAQTEKTFYEICEKEHIGVIWIPDKFSFYFSYHNRGFVGLPRKSRGLKLLFSMFHELGHHFVHAGDEPQVLWQSLANTREELEADAIALVAIMPIHLANDWEYLLDGSRYAAKLLADRKRIHFLYRI